MKIIRLIRQFIHWLTSQIVGAPWQVVVWASIIVIPLALSIMPEWAIMLVGFAHPYASGIWDWLGGLFIGLLGLIALVGD